MKVLFSGGGTLGPVTPLLAVAAEIRRRQPDTVLTWFGTKTGPERALVEAAGIKFVAIPSGKLRRYASGSNILDVFRIAAGCFAAFWLLLRDRPNVIVSAGGFVAVPVVWAGWLLRIPSHIHQMDVRPGLANRLCQPFARSISVSLEKSLADFPKKKTVWTGNPVRPELLTGSRAEAEKIFYLDAGVPTVLALGGGTGSSALNALVKGASHFTQRTCQIIHLSGKGKKDVHVAIRYHQLEFLAADMRHALAAADVVVARAGMGSLTELAALGKPAIIVPIPKSHQEDNARYFAARGAAIFLDEPSLTPERLAAEIKSLLTDPDRLVKMSDAMLIMAKPDAAAALAERIIAIGNQN